MALALPLGSLITFENTSVTPVVWQALSEHNRSSATLDIQRIEKTQRMSNGTLRKIFIADKDILSVSWVGLPTYSSMTVDGAWGAMNIKEFYESVAGQGAFNVKVSPNGTASREKTIMMSFTSCSFTVTKRNLRTGGVFKNSNITAISYAAGVTTYTGRNSFAVGNKISVSGATFAAYNGVFAITAATPTSFTVAGTISGTPASSTASAVTVLPEAQEFWDVSIALEEV
jgi:hypothetical protein